MFPKDHFHGYIKLSSDCFCGRELNDILNVRGLLEIMETLVVVKKPPKDLVSIFDDLVNGLVLGFAHGNLIAMFVTHTIILEFKKSLISCLIDFTIKCVLSATKLFEKWYNLGRALPHMH